MLIQPSSLNLNKLIINDLNNNKLINFAPYKLNNGDIGGTVDLTIRNDYDDVSKKIIV